MVSDLRKGHHSNFNHEQDKVHKLSISPALSSSISTISFISHHWQNSPETEWFNRFWSTMTRGEQRSLTNNPQLQKAMLFMWSNAVDAHHPTEENVSHPQTTCIEHTCCWSCSHLGWTADQQSDSVWHHWNIKLHKSSENTDGAVGNAQLVSIGWEEIMTAPLLFSQASPKSDFQNPQPCMSCVKFAPQQLTAVLGCWSACQGELVVAHVALLIKFVDQLQHDKSTWKLHHSVFF